MSDHAHDATTPAATQAPLYPVTTHDVTNQSGAWADAFIESRLSGLPNLAFGSLPHGTDMTAIIARSRLN